MLVLFLGTKEYIAVSNFGINGCESIHTHLDKFHRLLGEERCLIKLVKVKAFLVLWVCQNSHDMVVDIGILVHR